MYARMIEDTMKKKQIHTEALALGICSPEALNRIAAGEWSDWLTLNAILQRLDLPVELISVWVTEREYSYCQWRMRLLRSLSSCRWQKAADDLEQYQTYAPLQNQALELQFIEIVHSILTVEQENETEKAINLLDHALRLTQPAIWENFDSALMLFTGQEWCALLNLLSLKQKTEKKIYLQKILYRLEHHPLRESEQMKIYSYTVFLLTEIYLSENRHRTCLSLCEKAISLLRHGCGLGPLPKLLRCCASCRKALQAEGAEQAAKQADALEAVFQIQEAKRQYRWLITPMMQVGQKVWPLGQAVRQKRAFLQQSRKQLCKNLCSTKTLMRIEQGNGNVKKEYVEAILKCLHLPSSQLSGDISSPDASKLELLRRLSQLMSFHDREEFAGYLQDFKECINPSAASDLQWVSMFQSALDYNDKKINVSEYIEAIWKTICLSIPELQIDTIDKLICLNRIEEILLIQLSNRYCAIKKYDTTIAILKGLLRYYRRYKSCEEYQYHNLLLVYYNLMISFRRIDDYNKHLEVALKTIRLDLSCDRATALPGAVHCYAYSLYKKGHTGEAKKYFGLAIILGDMFNRSYISKSAKEMFEKLKA